MVRIILIFSLFFVCLFAKPIELSADRFYADEKSGENVLSGNVVVKKDQDILHSAKLLITTDSKRKPTKYKASGNASFNIILKDKHYKGGGNELIYDVLQDRYEITGNAFIQELVEKRRLYGDKIIIDKKQEKYEVISDKSKPVRFIFEVEER
ncbi:lipopolysaccharide transport periplasmic protein LptA [Campylobacter troglodytis]|uniref:lipopolysaccharide transport periplasmic protein LptA n=1 Tax=Campylobacter troglodytis TaxID=654363 RepID=UPI0011590EE0|nr:lipopolysaccharide transport periplasmic protein LptA [Campylobacter troglodytis]TQR60589.1 lipopolysaccharide transport periplasmic protein LptA [Campylobacter troglodytis]